MKWEKYWLGMSSKGSQDIFITLTEREMYVKQKWLEAAEKEKKEDKPLF